MRQDFLARVAAPAEDMQVPILDKVFEYFFQDVPDSFIDRILLENDDLVLHKHFGHHIDGAFVIAGSKYSAAPSLAVFVNLPLRPLCTFLEP